MVPNTGTVLVCANFITLGHDKSREFALFVLVPNFHVALVIFATLLPVY